MSIPSTNLISYHMKYGELYALVLFFKLPVAPSWNSPLYIALSIFFAYNQFKLNRNINWENISPEICQAKRVECLELRSWELTSCMHIKLAQSN